MKNKLLILALLVNTGLFAQAIPDGGFETWNTITWSDPQYYSTSNDAGNHNSTFSSASFPTASVTQVAGKYGKYGVQVSTIKFNNDTIGGYFIDANTGGKGLSGGIPYSQKPTGIRFWYKYTTTGTDTAAVLVIFKKSGTAIDSFLIVIPSSAATSSYTLHSYYPNHSLSTTPDTIIFGAASSKALISQNKNYNKGVIPGSTFTIDSVTFTGVGSSQPAELNGNFENWVTDTANIPNGWYISYPGTTITTDHYAGKYALQVETVNAQGTGIENGQANTGYWPNHCNNNCNEIGGYPFTNQVDTLIFWYKYSPKPNDTATVSFNFTKNGQNIFGTGVNFYTSVTTWTYVSYPFSLGQTPDTVIINISSSSHINDTSQAQYAPYVGSTFKIDNLAFKSQIVGIAPISNQLNDIKVYPNPVKETLYMNFSGQPVTGATTITIFDVMGKEVMQSQQSINKNILPVNVSGLVAGTYFIKVMNDTYYTVSTFIKQ